MSSPSSNSASDQVAPVRRFFEGTIRQIYERLNEQGVIALFKTTLMFAALFGLKEGLKGIFGFKCPRQGHYFYGNLYIFGPAVFFLCFAFVFSRPFWKFVTACCLLRCNKRLLSPPSSAIDIYLAISAPLLWVACGLSEEDYYICAMYGPRIESPWELRRWGSTGVPSYIIELRSEAKVLCHVLVWGILISWAITSAVMVSVYRCCIKDQEEKIQTGHARHV